MKNATIILGVIALLSACGGSVKQDKLTEKRAERDSLKAIYSETGKQIAKLETWIAKNDPDLKRNTPLVTTILVEHKTFKHYFDVHGKAEAKKNAVLFPSAPGNVRAVLVSEGQQVRKGQMLIDLDSDLISKQLDEVEANYELAKTTYERQKKLWDQNIGSEMQYLQAKSRKDALEASLETLREQERMQQIRAPFNGQVDEIFMNLGEMASPQLPIVRMVDLADMHLEADVSEAHINRTHVGDPVLVKFESLGIEFNSTIDHKGQVINPNNRSFKIWVSIPKGEYSILPNALGKVKIRDHEQDSATVVPTRLIQEDGAGRSFVYKLEKNDGVPRAKKVFVNRLMSYKGESLLENGNDNWKGNDILIDEGARLVVDGQEVRLETQKEEMSENVEQN
ncbi:MAG: hypothetical protein DRQ98_13680 [Gammaproteobacteria bacterium]|nr:MAG: hypothetical protein DRQ98_13680 [Gammaproteobacteria bacterium]